MGTHVSTDVPKPPTEQASGGLDDSPEIRLPRASGKFVSHVIMLITGNGLAQVINVVGTLVLARLFAPDAFGSLALFVTLVSFLSVLGGARYELAIMLPEKDDEAASILVLSVLILLGLTGVSLFLVPLLHAPVARFLGDDRLSLLLWGVPLALFVNGLYQVLGVWYGRMKRFRQLAIARVCQSVAIVGGQVGMLAFHSGAFALVGGWIFGQSLGTLILVAEILYSDGKYIARANNWKLVREAIGKYRNFPIYKAPYSFVSNAATQLVVVIIRIFSDLNMVGLYSMAARAVYLPVSLIASSMNDVFYEKAATELKRGGLEMFVTRLLRIQIVLAAPLLVLTAFDAKLIFEFVLGPEWVPAGTYAAILAFASFLYFLTSWLDRLFDVRGRQKLSLILEFAGNAISLGGLTLVLWWRPQDSALAVGVYAALQVLYSAIWLVFAYHVAGFNPRALGQLLRDAVVSTAIASALMGAIHITLRGWPAFFLSAIVACCMIAVAFIRYVSTGRAFSTTAERFRQFWADKETTLNGGDGDEFWRSQATELTQLFPAHPRRVLEIGCGDGNLFPHFRIPAGNYKGVDFSPQFIERFRSREPSVQLECAEGASYVEHGEPYDMILLNGVVQHFDPEMLDQHLQNACTMMGETGLLIWGSIPQRKHRTAYDSGKWSKSCKPSFIHLLRSWVCRLLGLDAMGYWYEPVEIAVLAKKYGLHTQFVSSRLYPYRFHALLTKCPARTEGRQPSSHFASPREMGRTVSIAE